MRVLVVPGMLCVVAMMLCPLSWEHDQRTTPQLLHPTATFTLTTSSRHGNWPRTCSSFTMTTRCTTPTLHGRAVDSLSTPSSGVACVLQFMLPDSCHNPCLPSTSPMIGGEEPTLVSRPSMVNAGRHGDVRITGLLLMMYTPLLYST